MSNTAKAACLSLILAVLILPAAAQRTQASQGSFPQQSTHGPVTLQPPVHCCGGLPMPERPIPPTNPKPQPMPAGGTTAGAVPSNGAPGSATNDKRELDPLVINRDTKPTDGANSDHRQTDPLITNRDKAAGSVDGDHRELDPLVTNSDKAPAPTTDKAQTPR
jgi:hypothetical protein